MNRDDLMTWMGWTVIGVIAAPAVVSLLKKMTKKKMEMKNNGKWNY